jgi:hypothetical protein
MEKLKKERQSKSHMRRLKRESRIKITNWEDEKKKERSK